MKKVLLLISLLLAGAACQKAPSRADLHRQLMDLESKAQNGDSNQAADAGEQALKMMDIDTLRDSDNLVKEGEEDFTFEAFDESLRIFEMARMKNPDNGRANAYLAILTPLSHLKGIYWRTTDAENDDQIGLALLQSYRLNGIDSFARFFNIPYKTKFAYWRDAIDEAIKPFVNDLLKSADYWDKVHADTETSISLHLPQLMTDVPSIRIRSADAQVASSFALGLATYARFYTIYDLGSAKFVRDAEHKDKHTAESDWEQLIQDPRFGLLTDSEFFSSLQGRYLQFTQGIDLAYAALVQRERSGQNDPQDLTQIGRGSVRACSSTAEDSRIIYETWSCQKPHEMAVPYVFSFWMGEARSKLKVRDVEGILSFEPTVQSLQAGIEIFKHALLGPVTSQTTCHTEEGLSYETTFWIDVPTYLQNPVKDLKQEGPIFDKNGEVRDLKDRTLHGLFPQGVPCAR